MKLRRSLLALSVAVFALAGCPDDDDDGTPDSGVEDTGTKDSGAPDTGEIVNMDGGTDAGEEDTGVEPDAGVVDLRIPELGDGVQVDFDEFGVLHVSCRTDLDCIAVQGYFHAAHRFGQMDLRRRFPKGEIAEILPLQPGIDQSRYGKTIFGVRNGDRIADQLWANSSTTTQAVFTAYTRGVNAWIDDLRNGENGARLTDDWAHLEEQVEDWEPQDSIACVLALIENLTNQSAYEVLAGQVLATVTPTMAWDLFSLRPPSPSTILMDDRTLTAVDTERLQRLAALQARLRSAKGVLDRLYRQLPKKPEGLGSNNWVLGPSRTADGDALLSNDPHLGLDFPSVWYLAHLDAKTNGTGQLHVAGASFAGLPGIVLGQNEDIAWGATTTFFDLADVYVETLNAAGDAVIFNGNEVPILERTFTIEVLGGQPVEHVVRYVPHHGPILMEDPQAGIAVTLKWTGQDATTDANFLWGMNTARNLEEARAALENVTTVGQNWVVIDTSGNFGWFPYNGVPNRPWSSALLPSWLPLPGDGSAEWEGVVPYAELPQSLNPPEGFIATANNDMTGHLLDGDPTNDGQTAWQHFVAAGYRHERIVDLIQDGTNTHTRDTMNSILGDTRVLIGERIVPAILAAADANALSPEGQLVHDALAAWDFECPTGLNAVNPMSGKDNDPAISASSIGCTAFHALYPRLIEATFADELAAQGIDTEPRTSAIVFALVQPDALIGSYWDDVSTPAAETMADTIGAALDDAGLYLGAHPRLGPDPDDWRWGRVHTVTLQPAIFPPSSGTYANDGGLFTVDVANPAGGDDFARQRSGPSMRFACAADETDGVDCTIQLPGGQRHFADSPHFEDLLQRWLVNDPIPLYFRAADVEAASVESVTVQPAN